MGKDQSLITPYPLILASTSKYRGMLLAQLGWPFESVAPGVDEDKVKTQGLSPLELAKTLSVYKAKAVFARYPGSCVIGSDQVCHLGNLIFSKPGSIEKACEQLSYLQGQVHELITAVTVLTPHGEETFTNQTRLHMRKLTLKDIHHYISDELPLECAGSYKLEQKGIKLFEKIEMDDHTSIIGLPLIQLTSTLLKIGYKL
jgi:septum formation protein